MTLTKRKRRKKTAAQIVQSFRRQHLARLLRELHAAALRSPYKSCVLRATAEARGVLRMALWADLIGTTPEGRNINYCAANDWVSSWEQKAGLA